MRDLNIVKNNVRKMSEQNAPMEDIDGYIASEGYTVDDIRNFKPQISEPSISRGEALLTTGTNIPFAPRIKAGVAATVAQPFTGENWGDLYSEALRSERNKLSQAREEYPIQSMTSQMGADIATGGKIIKGLGLAGQGFKTAIGAGAALGGLQAAGETADLTDLPQAAADTGLGAGLGAVFAGGLGGLDKALGRGKDYIKNALSKNPQAAVKRMNADDIKDLSTIAYKEAAEKGGTLKPEFLSALNHRANQLDKQTLIGKALAGRSPISEVKEVLSQFQGKKLDLESLQELDEVLGDRIDDYVENGVIKKAGLPLLKLQNNLRDMVENVDFSLIEGGKEGFEALKRGRMLWAKAAKLRDIDKIITRAEMTDNPATALKTGFRTLFNNENRLKFFNKEERKLIEKAAKSGVISDTLRTFGSRLIPIGSIVSGGGFPATAGAELTTMASRNLATKAQLAKAQKVAQKILGIEQKSYPIHPLTPIIASRQGSEMSYQP